MVKHIIIFGSTGVTGLCVTAAALERGLKIRAFVRDPTLLPEPLQKRVEIVKGDVLDYSAVSNGVKGTEAVVVALGTRSDPSPTTVLSDGLRNIISAMKEENVEIISVCLSAFLFFDIESGLVPDRLKDLTKEHRRMYDALKVSDLKYVAVFPPHISPDPATGYIVAHDMYISRKVSKYDLANFLLDCLDLKEYYKSVIGIASKRY
ncbi:flavin reductase (NADPH)-like [Dendroctonus ponderosae]